MIVISNLYIQYGDKVLFDSVTTTIQIGEKIGLTGRNGAGKSTLLKVIAGEISMFDGNIDIPKSETLAYLHQDITLDATHTVMEEALTAFEDLNELERKITVCEKELEVREDYETESYANLIDNLTHLTEQYEYRGGNQKEANIERILKGLGFKPADMNKSISELSGGWQMRVELAKMLLTTPDYLLLDEPTNHLDIESILWLEEFLKDYKGAVVMISHDKEFLDNITQKTIEIELGKLYIYNANYTNYLIQKAERKELMSAAFENQQKVIAAKEKTIARFMAKANKTSMAQSMQKQLAKMDRIEIEDEDTSSIKLKFSTPPRSAEVVLLGENVSKSYAENVVFSNVNFKLIRGERVAFVGQNGMGKSTLAKILIEDETPSDGIVKVGSNTLLGYYAQNQTGNLDSSKTLLQVMEDAAPADMRTKIRGILGSMMFSGEDVDKKVSVLSGGERGRLALALLLLNPVNLLVLDEPTNHLDIKAKEVLKKALLEYEGTMLVVSHDRNFLEGLTHRTIEFKDRTVKEYLGDINYFLEKRKTESFRVIEQGDKKEAASKTKSSAPNQDTEKQKAINKVERRIESLETEIAGIKAKMALDGFYEQPDHQSILGKYDQLEADLSKELAKWEELLV